VILILRKQIVFIKKYHPHYKSRGNQKILISEKVNQAFHSGN
jgi:hypothetical protein